MHVHFYLRDYNLRSASALKNQSPAPACEVYVLGRCRENKPLDQVRDSHGLERHDWFHFLVVIDCHD